MPGFPVNSLSSFVQAGTLSVNVFFVNGYCFLYAVVDVFSSAESAVGERLSNKINISTGCADLPFLIFMGLRKVSPSNLSKSSILQATHADFRCVISPWACFACWARRLVSQAWCLAP